MKTLFYILLFTLTATLASHALTISKVILPADLSYIHVAASDADGFTLPANILTANLSQTQQDLITAAVIELGSAIAPEDTTIVAVLLKPLREDVNNPTVVTDIVGTVRFEKNNKVKTVTVPQGSLSEQSKNAIVALWNGFEALTEAELTALTQ